jgi:hypothetical protein
MSFEMSFLAELRCTNVIFAELSLTEKWTNIIFTELRLFKKCTDEIIVIRTPLPPQKASNMVHGIFVIRNPPHPDPTRDPQYG